MLAMGQPAALRMLNQPVVPFVAQQGVTALAIFLLFHSFPDGATVVLMSLS